MTQRTSDTVLEGDLSHLQQTLFEITMQETDAELLLRRMLALLVQLTNARGGAVFLDMKTGDADSDEGLRLLHNQIPTEISRAVPELHEVLSRSARSTFATRRARSDSLGNVPGRVDVSRWVAISAPLFGERGTVGVITLLLDLGEHGAAEPYLVVLQTVSGYFQFHSLRGASGKQQAMTQHLAALLDLAGQCAACSTAAEAAFIVANELQRYLDCSQAAVSWWNGRKTALTAISGHSSFDRRGDFAQALMRTAAECATQAQPIHWPPRDPDQPRPIDLEHQALCTSADLGSVISHPLVSGEGVIGVCTFLWKSGTAPQSTDEPVIAVTSGQIGPILHTLHRADRGVLQTALDSSKHSALRLLGPGRHKAKIVATIFVATILLLCFWRVPHRVTASCVLQPVTTRVVSAPFDGILVEVFVRPGDVVTKDTPLARLDDAELRLQMESLRSEHRSAAIEAARHLAENSRADHQLARAAMDKFAAQLELTEFWITRARIMSPVDGVVLQGDLERAIGAPVATGDVLFEVAPIEQLLLEIEVLDRDVAWIRAEQTGHFALESRPEQPIPLTVECVRPVAEPRNQNNTFVAEALVANDQYRMRPGMIGTAKVNVGRRPLGWVLSHRIVDWVRVQWWKRSPW